MVRAFCTILLLVAAKAMLLAGDTVVIRQGFTKQYLDDIVTVLVDSNENARLNAFSEHSYTAVPCEIKSPGHMLNMGYTRNVWWLHFTVSNQSNQPALLRLFIGGGIINHAELFLSNDKGGNNTIDSLPPIGINYAYQPTYFSTRGWSYPLQLAPGETVQYWLRLQNDLASLRVPLELWQEELFVGKTAINNIGWGLFFGILALTLIGAFSVFAATTQRVFLYYGLYILSLIVFNSTSLGLPTILLNIEGAYGIYTVIFSANVFLVITMLLFSNAYLNLTDWARWLRNLIFANVGILVVMTLLWFVWPRDMDVSYWFIHFFTFLPLISICILLVAVALQKVIPKQHKLFLVAFTPLVLLTAGVALRNNGFIGHSLLFDIRLPLSFAIETVVFSYALAIRIRDMRYEREELLRKVNEQQRDSFKAVIEATERERKRVAEDLHDGLGQLLSTAKLNLTAIDGNLGNEEMGSINTSVALLDEACQEVRHISHNMMPGTLIRLGLVSAIKEQARKINESGKILVTVSCAGFEQRLPEAKEIAIYRVLQELLNNAIRYSGATDIEIVLDELADGYLFKVKDNGKGFEPKTLENSKGIGWRNIRSRIDMMQGNIDLKTAPGQGTLLHLWVPKKSISN